jgi:hypothetical protein
MTNSRVVYGHPFETPVAQMKSTYFDICLTDFSTKVCSDILEKENVRYILIYPERIPQVMTQSVKDMPQVFSSGKVRIYEVK